MPVKRHDLQVAAKLNRDRGQAFILVIRDEGMARKTDLIIRLVDGRISVDSRKTDSKVV